MAGQEKRNVGLFKKFLAAFGSNPTAMVVFCWLGLAYLTPVFFTLGIDRVSASCPWVAEDCQRCLGINPCTRWTLYPYAVARLKG